VAFVGVFLVLTSLRRASGALTTRPPGLLVRRVTAWRLAPLLHAMRSRRGALALAPAAAVGGRLCTGWIAGGARAATAALGMPALLRPGAAATAQIDRLEALEEWVRHLADVHHAGISLEQAVRISLRTAPAAVRGEVGVLVARLQSGWSPEAAYRAFAA